MGDTAKLIERLDDASGAMCSFPDHRDINLHGLTERAGTFLDGVHDLLIESRHALAASEATVASLRAEVGRLTKALEPFALVAEHDIGIYELDEETFLPVRAPNNRAPLLMVGDFRTAARALDRSPSVEPGNG